MSAGPALTLAQLARDLASARTTSRQLVEGCLANIAVADGEGSRVFLTVHAQQALAAADFHDQMRRHGAAASMYAGIPISVKDLFDLAGDVTTAGSTVLRGTAPAVRDAAAVARLKAAGFVVIGRTNMTEFAFSGLGVNPHYGTPLNPWERANRRIPGGSSSGAAVSVTDSMAFAALGTDTGGSCRIPAALCGIVGFKPTASRIPLAGCYPLCTTLDSAGPLANSVACCAVLDAVLSGEPAHHASPTTGAEAEMSVGGLRFGVLGGYVLEGLVTEVASGWERALRALAKADARLSHIVVQEFDELPRINRKGGLSSAEAYALHRERLASDASQYDPRVAARILRGREQDAADYIDLHAERASFITQVTPRLAAFDALLMPTLPIIAPLLTDLASDEAYVRLNMLALRNSSVVNFLDGCAISIPCQEPGAAPVGLTIFSLRATDRRLLAIAGAVESCLR
jgi:aspartyl-tRNA(Asn)/glutamyl-tRNA(Gln) amidotransferase subunit A